MGIFPLGALQVHLFPFQPYLGSGELIQINSGNTGFPPFLTLNSHIKSSLEGAENPSAGTKSAGEVGADIWKEKTWKSCWES